MTPFVGGTGHDHVRAGWGEDLFIEGENTGNDTYYGDQDFDTVSYAAVTGGISVDLNLNDGQVFGANVDADSLRNVENIIGGMGDDTMLGNDEENCSLTCPAMTALMAATGWIR